MDNMIKRKIIPEEWKENIDGIMEKQMDWHNVYYENLLKPVVERYLKKNSKELSPKEVLELKKIYS